MVLSKIGPKLTNILPN